MAARERGHGRPKLWTYTNSMNMHDLSRDDDFLSTMLVESLGSGTQRLVVHKMDPSRRIPHVNPEEVLPIIRKWLLYTKTTAAKRVRGAVDALLRLAQVQHYLRLFTQAQLNAFATHAARYLEIYLPSAVIEIAQTDRYSHRTGKAELCILATRSLPVGSVIAELKGSMAVLTEEENEDLKRTDRRSSQGARRDFSVIHSGHRKKNHLFLGPARFVNHDCDNNCDLIREGRYITFRVIKPISAGQEITAHYGDAYFGKGNRHCLCETCEKTSRGGYRQDEYTDSDHSSDSDVSITVERTGLVENLEVLGTVNERRTRRGVYMTLPSSDSESNSSDESEIEDQSEANMKRLKQREETGGAMQLSGRVMTSQLTSNSTSPSASALDLLASSARASFDAPSDTVEISTSLTSLSPSPRATTNISLSNSTSVQTNQITQGLSSASTRIATVITRSSSTRSLQMALAVNGSTSQLSGERGRTLARLTRSKSTVELKVTSIANNSEPRAHKVNHQRETSTARSDIQVSVRSHSKLGSSSKPDGREASSHLISPTRRSTSPNRKRGGLGRQPKTCGTCSRALLATEVENRATSIDLECLRCKRHFVIFGSRWPSRVPPVLPVLRSPSPGSSPEPSPRRKRSLLAMHFDRGLRQSPEQEEFSAKRSRRPSNTVIDEFQDGRRLSKQEIRRLRKNQRRREARAKARAARLTNLAPWHKRPCNMNDATLEEALQGDHTELLSEILRAQRSSWHKNMGQSRPVARQRFMSTPEALSAKSWMLLNCCCEAVERDQLLYADPQLSQMVDDAANRFFGGVVASPSGIARHSKAMITSTATDLDHFNQSDPLPAPACCRITYLHEAAASKLTRSPTKYKSNGPPLNRWSTESSRVHVDHGLPRRAPSDDITKYGRNYFAVDEDRLEHLLGTHNTKKEPLHLGSSEDQPASCWTFHQPLENFDMASLGAAPDCPLPTSYWWRTVPTMYALRSVSETDHEDILFAPVIHLPNDQTFLPDPCLSECSSNPDTPTSESDPRLRISLSGKTNMPVITETKFQLRHVQWQSRFEPQIQKTLSPEPG